MATSNHQDYQVEKQTGLCQNWCALVNAALAVILLATVAPHVALAGQVMARVNPSFSTHSDRCACSNCGGGAHCCCTAGAPTNQPAIITGCDRPIDSLILIMGLPGVLPESVGVAAVASTPQVALWQPDIYVCPRSSNPSPPPERS